MAVPRLQTCMLAVLVTSAMAVSTASAQEHHHEMAPVATAWTWNWDAMANVQANLQERKYTDFHQLESQNWFMVAAARSVGAGVMRLHAMGSLEPFTLRRLGSAQVFQTGETLDGTPLLDYQHPHDLFMALEASWDRPVWNGARFTARIAPIGDIAFGPDAFMHRASAMGNTTAPLNHHQLDSTHSTRSAITASLARGSATLEASAFKGAEPDEDRLDLDLGAPDSVAARFRWRRPSFGFQISGAHVTEPEIAHAGDARKVTMSIDGRGNWRGAPAVWTLAYGQSFEQGASTGGVLFEAAWYRWATGHAYTRIEISGKQILPEHADTDGVHTDPVSKIGAVTIGYEHPLRANRLGRLAIGGDVTVHAVPFELKESYGVPVSIHVGIRYRR